MAKANSVTYICFVQDHSGSMYRNATLATDNFNEQRAKLLKEDDDTMDNIVTVIEFDDEIHCNIENTPINEIKELKKWWTGGMTALFDAIAFGIDKTKKKLDADEREDKAALIIVQTDGQENKSSDYAGEYGRIRLNELINKLEDTKIWSFTFLGENIDKKVAMDMGFKASNIMSHKSGRYNVKTAYTCSTQGLDGYMKARKRGVTQIMNFYNDDSKTDDEPDNS
jgi:uncharacterized protein YegL